MPSIEIIAVGQTQPVDVSALPFAVLADPVLRSHRTPSRFQHDFDRLSGILYHLGNPSLKDDWEGRFFFASKLLSAASRKIPETFLEFGQDYRGRMETFLEQLMSSSRIISCSSHPITSSDRTGRSESHQYRSVSFGESMMLSRFSLMRCIGSTTSDGENRGLAKNAKSQATSDPLRRPRSRLRFRVCFVVTCVSPEYPAS